MKKSIIIFLLLVLTSVLVGCSISCKKTVQHIDTGTYVIEASEEAIKPNLSLEDNNRFTFNYSLLSSYIAIGSYEIDNDILTLKTDDDKYTYVFEIKDNTLIFKESESSDFPSYVSIYDGSIFK